MQTIRKCYLHQGMAQALQSILPSGKKDKGLCGIW